MAIRKAEDCRVKRYCLFLAMLLPTTSQAVDSISAITLAGKECTESDRQQIDCTYSVGKDLEFIIAGIGESDTAITFMRSSFDGDYYGSVGVMHGCVIVKPGKKTLDNDSTKLFQYVFVSPRNGKVYSSWQECKTSR